MYTNNLDQLKSFSIFIIVGIIISIIFDIFRILRKTIKTSDILTYIEDTLFWITSGLIILFSIFIFNNGELRSYIFIGIFLGILFYILFISKYFININVIIISYIKKCIKKIFIYILIPFKIVYKIIKKIIFKPFSFIFINLRIIFIKLAKNFKNIKIFDKKLDKKEGI